MVKSRITSATCLFCVLVYILEILLGGNVVFNIPTETLLNLGASNGPLTIGQAQYGRLISCIFLHAYLLHLALNTYVLIDFGPLAEASLGRKLYSFIFLFSGIVGALTSILYNPTQTSVGASAAILGLLGALIYKTWFEKDGARFSRPQLVMLCIFLLYSLLLGFTSNVIDNAAHLGGFFAGMITCAAFFGRGSAKTISARRALIASGLLLALIPALIYADTKRVNNNPDVVVSIYRKDAQKFRMKDDFAQALVKLNAAQEASPNKVSSILLDRAEILEQLDQHEAALKDINLWLTQNKDSVEGLRTKSYILHKLGKEEAAIQCVNLALDVNPPSTILDFLSGTAKNKRNQAGFYNDRAWFKLGLGQIKEALADCDQALSLNGQMTTAYDTRGTAYLMLKDFTQAEKDFSRSLELSGAESNRKKGDTESGAAYYHRAIARSALGDKDGAKEDMDRFKSLDYKPEPWEPKP